MFQSNDNVFQVGTVYIQVRIGLIRLIRSADPSLDNYNVNYDWWILINVVERHVKLQWLNVRFNIVNEMNELYD